MDRTIVGLSRMPQYISVSYNVQPRNKSPNHQNQWHCISLYLQKLGIGEIEERNKKIQRALTLGRNPSRKRALHRRARGHTICRRVPSHMHQHPWLRTPVIQPSWIWRTGLRQRRVSLSGHGQFGWTGIASDDYTIQTHTHQSSLIRWLRVT